MSRQRSDTRRAGTGEYDPIWAYMWFAWLTVLEKGRR